MSVDRTRGMTANTSKSRRHPLDRTNFQLFIIALIVSFDSLAEASSQYEVANLQQHDHYHYQQQQTALPKQSLKVSTSVVTSSSLLKPSVAPNPSQSAPHSGAVKSNSSPVSVVQAAKAVGQSSGRPESARDGASVISSSQLDQISNRSRQNGKILDYTLSAIHGNSQQFQPMIAQWPRQQQITQPPSQLQQAHQNPIHIQIQTQHQYQEQRPSRPPDQLSQARVYNYLEPVTQQRERQHQARLYHADDAIGGAERVSSLRRVLLIDGRSAPVNEPPQQTTPAAGVPQSTRQQDSSSSSGSGGGGGGGGANTGSNCDSLRTNPRSLKTLLKSKHQR